MKNLLTVDYRRKWGKKPFWKAGNQVYLLILVTFHAQIKDSQINADPCESGSRSRFKYTAHNTPEEFGNHPLMLGPSFTLLLLYLFLFLSENGIVIAGGSSGYELQTSAFSLNILTGL